MPAPAAVRPRAIRAGWPEQRLLEDIVGELFEEGVRGVVPIVGQPGSGKSIALAHLAAVFETHPQIDFRDHPDVAELHERPAEVLWIISSPPLPYGNEPVLRLTPWGQDELIEYLLTLHPQHCAAVVQRLGPAARRSWSPQLATIVMERFVANPAAADPDAELIAYIDEALPEGRLRQSIRAYGLAVLLDGNAVLDDPFLKQVYLDCGDAVRPLLRHREVRLPLAADRISWSLANGSTVELKHPLPVDLIEAVGARCREEGGALAQLSKDLRSGPFASKHPMAASIMHAADPSWMPHTRIYGAWNLTSGYFPNAHWPHVQLVGARLENADFSNAQLESAVLETARLSGARFDGANLSSADLRQCTAVAASFAAANFSGARISRANLHQANLSSADLTRADLASADLAAADLSAACFNRAQLTHARLTQATITDTDFTDAMLYHTNLTSLDLRSARLNGATMTKANLTHANLEDIVLPNARFDEACFRQAHLTGSRLPAADFRGADLRGAGLAEIHWEGADLRDANLAVATFHLGSSRSGLVGSPIACEGSKTGFYTDDYEDMHFKRPEEIRKANLRAADLRGANITGLDFYLVDLRDARLDPQQLVHVRKCGAILADFVA